MTTYLPDANVLIALSAHEHVHHVPVDRWASTVDSFAVCPTVEGALVRFSVRLGASVEMVQETLRALHSRPGFEFWPDDRSYLDVDLAHVRGHRQVTDAYLASLAGLRPDARVATIDEGFAQALPSLASLVPT
ncbi:MAG: PIN domain-containing protein [Chloroflexi bacterium]|nr:PIN domain-containing protein [Chloroflexota bacterium]